MITLGIETSCDETALCLLETKGDFSDGQGSFEYRVLSHIVHSQIDIHTKYGGVYPMMAKREHAKRLVPLLEQAIKESGIKTTKIDISSADLEHAKKICGEHDTDLYQSLLNSSLIKERPAIDRIAVTHGPGLEPALWVGINFANALAWLWRLPVVGKNHMEGHIVASLARGTSPAETKNKRGGADDAFENLIGCRSPAIAFLVSGGHTEIVLVKEIGGADPQENNYRILGQTRDDAAGEAFDKVARMLGLPYPGGPEISRLAEISRKDLEGKNIFDKNKNDGITLPRPMIDADTLDMSFAGLKTAVLYELRKHEIIDEPLKREIAREFEDAVTDVIIAKLERAFDAHPAQTLIVGGGVFANKHILEACKQFAARRGVDFLPPAPGLSGDNALMIAIAGAMNEKIEAKEIRAQGNLSLDKNL